MTAGRTDLGQRLRDKIPRHGVGAGKLHQALLAVLDLHTHRAYDQYCRLTDDLSNMDARYGMRCNECGCGSIALGWCPTVLAIADVVGIEP